MNNQRFIKSVLEICDGQSGTRRRNMVSVDYEYILRYFEIHRESLFDKYKTAFADDAEDYLITSFVFFGNAFKSNGDIRILNTLYKYRTVIEKLSMENRRNELSLLVNTSLKRLINE